MITAGCNYSCNSLFFNAPRHASSTNSQPVVAARLLHEPPYPHHYAPVSGKEGMRTCPNLLKTCIIFFLTAKKIKNSGLPMQAEIKQACFQSATKCASLEMLKATCALEENVVILLLSASETFCASAGHKFCNSLHSANPVNNRWALRQNFCQGCSSHH